MSEGAFRAELASFFEFDPGELKESTRFVDDLAFDSLMLFELLLFLEDHIDATLPVELVEDLHDVSDVYHWYATRAAQSATPT